MILNIIIIYIIIIMFTIHINYHIINLNWNNFCNKILLLYAKICLPIVKLATFKTHVQILFTALLSKDNVFLLKC